MKIIWEPIDVTPGRMVEVQTGTGHWVNAMIGVQDIAPRGTSYAGAITEAERQYVLQLNQNYAFVGPFESITKLVDWMNISGRVRLK